MSTYDTLTRAEIQEFQKAKVLNEKIGKITPQTAVSLQTLLKKNPSTFKTGVGQKLAQAAGEIKETGRCNCIYCGTNRAAEGKVLCEQHQKINFVRMAEMKKQEENVAINTAENNLKQNAIENNPQQNAAGNNIQQNPASAVITQQGQDKKKKLIKYALIVAAFFIVVSFIGGKKSAHFADNDLANYIGKPFEELQKHYPQAQIQNGQIYGLDNNIYIPTNSDNEIGAIYTEKSSSFVIAGIYVGLSMETAQKQLEKLGKVKVDPEGISIATKINGKKCTIMADGYGTVEDIYVYVK